MLNDNVRNFRALKEKENLRLKSYISRINNAMPDFNPLETRIANFFVCNQNEILRLPIQQIAEKCDCSQSAIVRFCQRLGYSGFKDFKHQVTDLMFDQYRHGSEQPAHYSDIQLDGSLNTIISRITENNLKSLQDTADIIDEATLVRAIHAISDANRVVFYAVGGSAISAADAYQKFVRIGKNCQFFEDSHLQISSAVTLKKGDIAVLISYSGKTKDLLCLIPILKESEVTTIAITKYGSSPLGKLCDMVLNVVSTDIPVRSASFSSRIAQLSVIDMLFTGVASLNYDKVKPILERGYLLCEKKKSTATNKRMP